jgi:hypothetical protein
MSHTDSLLPAQAFRYYAERANGGICSIAVRNLLLRMSQINPDHYATVRAIYDGDFGIFRQPADFYRPSTTETATGRYAVSLAGHNFNVPLLRRRQKNDTVPATETQPEHYTFLADEVLLDNGVPTRLCFTHNYLGVAVRSGLNHDFIPTVKINPRGEDSACDYASLVNTPITIIENNITTKWDDNRLIGTYEDPGNGGRGFIAAGDLLDMFTQLTDGDQATRDTIRDGLYSIFGIEELVNSALGLEADKSYYTKEQTIRSLAETALRNNQRRIANWTVAGPQNPNDRIRGPATDRSEHLAFVTGEDNFDLVYDVVFPKASDPKPQLIARVAFGQRIGELAADGPFIDEVGGPDAIISLAYDKFDSALPVTAKEPARGLGEQLQRNRNFRDSLDQAERLWLKFGLAPPRLTWYGHQSPRNPGELSDAINPDGTLVFTPLLDEQSLDDLLSKIKSNGEVQIGASQWLQAPHDWALSCVNFSITEVNTRSRTENISPCTNLLEAMAIALNLQDIYYGNNNAKATVVAPSPIGALCVQSRSGHGIAPLLISKHPGLDSLPQGAPIVNVSRRSIGTNMPPFLFSTPDGKMPSRL